MPSAVSHFLIGATLALPFTGVPSIREAVQPVGLMFSAGLLAATPDLDTIFFGIIPYAHFFGHRGFFHSPFFAICAALALSCLMFALSRSFTIGASIGIAAAFAIAIASHGILDAMTNEGLGVMLLYPFSDERISFPWRPFHSPPIKLSNLSWHQVQMMLKSEFPIVSRLRHHRRDGQIRFGSHWRQGKAEGYLIRGIRSTQKPLYCEIMHYLCPMPNFRDIALYRRNQSL